MEESSKIYIYSHKDLMKEYVELSKSHKELLEFYLESLNNFDDIFEEKRKRFSDLLKGAGKPLSGRYVHIILQTKEALDSLYSHYFSVKKGLCNGTYPALRHAFESLLKNYYMLTCPEGTSNFMQKSKDSPGKIRWELYSGKEKISHDAIYNGLCKKVHAGVISCSPAYFPEKDTYKDCIEFGLIILAGHYFFLIEAFGRFFDDDEIIKFKPFIEKLDRLLGMIPNLIPNNSPRVDVLGIPYDKPFLFFESPKETIKSEKYYLDSCILESIKNNPPKKRT